MITSSEEVSKNSLNLEIKNIAERMGIQHVKDALYFPKFFQIETIRVCNARCPFCAIDQWDKSTPMMSDELFDKIVNELSEYAHWIDVVNLARAGEPLLDKKIVERTRQIKEAGIKKITLSTNASKLTEEKSIGLLNAGLDDIMLSIDSVEKENYEKMRVGLKYETVMSNIETLFKVRDEIKPDAIVRVRGVSYFDLENSEDRRVLNMWEEFWEKFKKPHDRIYMKKLHSWGNQIDVADRTEGIAEADYGEIYHPCIIPWSTMHISAMGIVGLCPQDYDAKFNLGDINNQSIAEVWQDKKLEKIRKLHQSGERNKIKLCQGCKIFDLDFSIEKKDQKELYTD